MDRWRAKWDGERSGMASEVGWRMKDDEEEGNKRTEYGEWRRMKDGEGEGQ